MMQALLALQSIKHTYHSDVAFYDEKLHQKERFKNRIESHMQSALQNGEFRLFLQPKMRLSDDGLARCGGARPLAGCLRHLVLPGGFHSRV